MKRTILLSTVALLFCLTSCNNESTSIQEVELLKKGQTFSIFHAAGDKSIQIDSMESAPKFLGIGHRPQPLIPEKLPASYLNRKFLKGLAAMTYDIFLIPGNIVKYNENDSTYELKTLRGIIKNDSLPKVVNIEDGINYSSKINSGASINGSYLIGGASIEANRIMELIIQDISKSVIPPSLIDMDRIKSLTKNIPLRELKNYFYIKTATLTFINSRKYAETKIDFKINATYVTAEGKVYSTNDKFSRERLVSVDLVSLDNLLE